MRCARCNGVVSTDGVYCDACSYPMDTPLSEARPKIDPGLLVCQKCEALNQNYMTFVGSIERKLFGGTAGHYVGNIYHFHDLNAVLQRFSCSNEHEWTVHHAFQCPAGDWGYARFIEYHD